MRRLVLLLSSIVAVDIMFFTALAPLLPHFVSRYGLSKGEAGVLSATYAAGVLAASVPGGMAASRLGPRRAALGGVALTALASLGFALAENAWMLGAARLLQGIGSAFSWAGALAWLVAAAPRERRGELIGTTMGAAVFGALLGPVLGALASAAGVRVTFLAVSVVGLALCAWVVTTPGAAPQPQPLSTLRRADRRLLGGLWLLVLPALLFGVLVVLVPLKLHARGWGGVAIGAVFLATAAVEVVLNPLLGRLTDRRGGLVPVQLALLGSLAVSVALAWADAAALVAALVLAAGVAYGAFYTPGMALISDGAERRGIAPALAFGVMNGAWAAGNVVGPAIGGALAEIAGDALPYLLLAAICLLTLLATMPRVRAPAIGRSAH
ncbi:MAG TPA: MFS transporter [Gaiellaceae bacterium]|jgi:MFS family permease|nr:MFS transporter [Gaiellaceae bacterium]